MNQKAKGDREGQKGEWPVRDRQSAGGDRAELHEDPAALHPAVVATIVSWIALRPEVQSPLEAMDREWHHPHGHREEEPARGRHAGLPERLAGAPERCRVERGDERDTETVEAVPRFGDEPAHRAEHDDGAGVVGDVSGVKPRSRARTMAEEVPEPVCLFSGHDVVADRRLRSSQVMVIAPPRVGIGATGATAGSAVGDAGEAAASGRYPRRQASTDLAPAGRRPDTPS